MSGYDRNNIRDEDNLTVSEIDRIANCDFESDAYSSDDSYRQSDNDTSEDEEDEMMSTTLDNTTSPAVSNSIIDSPGPSGSTNTTPTNVTPPVYSRNKKAPRRVLPWNDLAQLKTFLFTEPTGLKVPVPGNKPIDWFSLVIDDIFLQSIVTETNKYAEELFLSQNTKEKSRICNWKQLSLEELKTFLGLLFHTGILRLPEIQHYWKHDELFKTCFGKYMSRDRFMLIMRCLHVSNSDNNTDRLHKIKPAVDYFNNKMWCINAPSKELSLDESMVLWRGRLVFKQYIKNKRHKYGIKLYMLTEPNGLVMKFAVYAGANDVLSGEGHSQKVVLHLMNDWLGKGHSVFSDNFYNSISLTQALIEKKTYITGTLRQDRVDVSTDVTKAKLKKGDTVAKYCEGIMVGKWKDVRDVTYISSQYENVMNVAVNKRGQEKMKPLPIIEYNNNMSGIDRQDQMMSYYPCERKTIRWYKKLLVHILQMGILNAYFLYNKYTITSKMTMLDFRLQVIKSLLGSDRQVEVEDNREHEGEAKHVPAKLPINNKGVRGRKKCKLCTRNGTRKDTTYYCKACPGEPALCLENCFEIHHA